MSTALTIANQEHGLMPVMSVQEAQQRYNIMVEFTKSVMVKDQDFGVIPGVAKPCLYKAGAEKLSSLFGFTPCFTIIERTEDWTGKDHGGEPFFYYFYKCQLLRGGEIVGEGDGSCNSWEKKYRYRSSERKCPKCGKPTIIAGKQEYGGGWLCFAKKGGCNAKFKTEDPAIMSQEVGQVPNPDISEIVNTLQKMAQKRSLVAAVLIACNASAFYTQDVEDMRTIDVDWQEVPGSKEAAAEVAERKLSELRKVPAGSTISPQDIADTEPEPSGLGGALTGLPPSEDTLYAYEQREAAKRAEAAETISSSDLLSGKATVKPARKRGSIPFDALKHFGVIKKALCEETGDDAEYYRILKGYGYDHADEIVDKEEARTIYKVMAGAHARMVQDAELQKTLTNAQEALGIPKFIAILGAHGCENVTQVLAMDGTPLENLLGELKQAIADQKGKE